MRMLGVGRMSTVAGTQDVAHDSRASLFAIRYFHLTRQSPTLNDRLPYAIANDEGDLDGRSC